MWGFLFDVDCSCIFPVTVLDNNMIILCSSSNGLGNKGEVSLFVKGIIVPSEPDAPKA